MTLSLVSCTASETPRSKGIYFKTEIELALEQKNYQRAEELAVEMGHYVLNLTVKEAKGFHSAWPSPEAGVKWTHEVKAKIIEHASMAKSKSR